MTENDTLFTASNSFIPLFKVTTPQEKIKNPRNLHRFKNYEHPRADAPEFPFRGR